MKILFINTYLSGGAAKGAKFLFNLIKKNTHGSRFLFLHGEKQRDSDFIKYNDFRWFDLLGSKKVSRFIRNIVVSKNVLEFGKNYKYDDRFSSFSLSQTTIKSISTEDFDIIHLNWIAKFFDYYLFFSQISKKQRIVLTLRDMNCFTGGCHHADNCTQFFNVCDDCPQLKLSSLNNDIKEIFLEKEKALFHLADDQMIIACPSKWVMLHSSKSRLLGRFEHVYIPHGIDINKYYLKDKMECRKKLGINTEKMIVLFVAHSLDNKRKGFEMLLKAFDNIKSENICLISVGNIQDKEKLNSKKFDHISLGYIDSDEKMADVYNSADVFITPSLAESFGFTIAESLCCGTPVISFETTAITEKIYDSKNGYLVELGSSSDLSIKIDKFLKQGVALSRKEIFLDASKKYSHIKMVDKYLDIYNKVLHK